MIQLWSDLDQNRIDALHACNLAIIRRLHNILLHNIILVYKLCQRQLSSK